MKNIDGFAVIKKVEILFATVGNALLILLLILMTSNSLPLIGVDFFSGLSDALYTLLTPLYKYYLDIGYIFVDSKSGIAGLSIVLLGLFFLYSIWCILLHRLTKFLHAFAIVNISLVFFLIFSAFILIPISTLWT